MNLGLLRLSNKYGDERVEAACVRALRVRAYSYRNVKSILEHDLDRQPSTTVDDAAATVAIEHENIRGAKYYH